METIEEEMRRAALTLDDPSDEPVPEGEGLDPGLLDGPDGPRMGANVGRNMEEDRIRFALAVFERQGPASDSGPTAHASSGAVPNLAGGGQSAV